MIPDLPIPNEAPVSDAVIAARLGIPLFGVMRIAAMLDVKPIGGRLVFSRADAQRMIDLLSVRDANHPLHTERNSP